MSQTNERGRHKAPGDQKEQGGRKLDVERRAPHRAECGTVVEMNGRTLTNDPERLPTTTGGAFCKHEPLFTVLVEYRGDPVEIAMCERHRKCLDGHIQPVVQ